MSRSGPAPLIINGWTIFAHPLFLAQLEALVGQVHALLPQRRPPQHDARPVQQIAGDRDYRATGGRFQRRSLRPLVERPHARPAPHLVVELARRLAGVRPPARQAQVPAERQGHFVLAVGVGPRGLRRVALEPELARLSPDFFERKAE